MWPNQKRKMIPRIFIELIAIMAHLTQVCLIYYYKKREKKNQYYSYND